MVLAAGAAASTVSIATPTAVPDAQGRTIRLGVVVNAPTDPAAYANLIFTWTCNNTVVFSSANSTNSGSVVTAVLPQVGTYHFTVLVEDQSDFTTVTGTTSDVVISVHPTSIRAVEMASQNSFTSIFSPDAGSVNASFAATMLDQFGTATLATIVDTDGHVLSSGTVADLAGVTWVLSWGAVVEEGITGNPSTINMSPTGLLTVRHGEGVHSYAVTGSLKPYTSPPTPGVPGTGTPATAFNIITGTAIVQTNQVKIMFKPGGVLGVPGYLFDTGLMRTAAVDTSIQWGWNIAGLDVDAMRSRNGLGVGGDQIEGSFALLQALTYREISAADNPADLSTIGSLKRDLSGQAIVAIDLSAAPAPDNMLMWRLWNLPQDRYSIDIMAGDPLDVGRTVDLVLTCGTGAGAPSIRILGTTTAANPWITGSSPMTVIAGQPLILTSGPAAERNLINTIAIKRSVNN